LKLNGAVSGISAKGYATGFSAGAQQQQQQQQQHPRSSNSSIRIRISWQHTTNGGNAERMFVAGRK